MGNTGSAPTSEAPESMTTEDTAPKVQDPSLEEDNAEDTKSKLCDAFAFVEMYEECRLTKKSSISFIQQLVKADKETVDDDDDEPIEKKCWTDHYNQKSSKGGVLLTSYQVDEWKKEPSIQDLDKHIRVHGDETKDTNHMEIDSEDARNDEQQTPDAPNSTTSPWLQIRNPALLKIPTSGPVRDFLEQVKGLIDPGADCKTLADVLHFIKPEDLDGDLDFAPEVAVHFCHEYWLAQEIKPVYKSLFDFATSDDTSMECVFNFGQCRQRFKTTPKKPDKFINSPLIEVNAAVHVSDNCIELSPAVGARIKVNMEAKDLVIKDGGGNSGKAKKLDEFVAQGRPELLSPGNWKTQLHYLQEARLGWDTELKDPNSETLHHPPDNPYVMVLNPGWSVTLRSKRSSIFSEDAQSIKSNIANGNIPVTRPLYALIYGSSKSEAKPGNLSAIPLRASPAQELVLKQSIEERHPILAVQGAPGTGKSSVGVNRALIAAATGESSLITASSPETLEECLAKVPDCKEKKQKMEEESIRKMFCLDVSCLDKNRTTELSNQLECMHHDLSKMLSNKKDYSAEVHALQTNIAELKLEAKKTMEKMKEAQSAAKDIQKDSTFQMLLKNHILQKESALIIADEFYGLVQDAVVEGNEEIDFVFHNDDISNDFLKYVARKANGETATSTESTGRYRIQAASSKPKIPPEIEEELSKIEIRSERRAPNTAEEWGRASRGLSVRKRLNEFMKREVSSDLVKVSKQKVLLQSLFFLEENKRLQARHHQILENIQRDERRLIEVLILETQRKSLTDDALSKLYQLSHAAQKLKGSDPKSRKKAHAGNYNAFKDALVPCLEFIPLVFMTAIQACELVPSTHCFNNCIIDEASQMDCTGLNLLVRAHQFVVLGDHKQISPAAQKWSDESKNALAASKPQTRFAEQMMPGNGNSFFDITKQAVPTSSSLLSDHFRCPANGLGWNNDKLYHNRMKTYKPSWPDSVMCIRVEGEWDTEEGNKNEATKVVEFVVQKLKSLPRQSPGFKIVVVAFPGEVQANLIDGLLEEPLDRLYLEDKDKERHKIIVTGEQKDIQGCECNLMILSAGFSTGEVPFESGEESEQFFNVVGTRNTEQLVLFHSYDLKDIKQGDVKRDYFPMLMDAARTSSADSYEQEGGKLLAVEFGPLRKRLLMAIEESGYRAYLNVGTVWGNSLAVTRQGQHKCALIFLENEGEKDEDWSSAVQDQYILECAGTPCLRVDTVALALCFRKTIKQVLEFLNESMPQHLAPVAIPLTVPSPSAPGAGGEILVSSESETVSSELSTRTKPAVSSRPKRAAAAKKKIQDEARPKRAAAAKKKIQDEEEIFGDDDISSGEETDFSSSHEKPKPQKKKAPPKAAARSNPKRRKTEK